MDDSGRPLLSVSPFCQYDPSQTTRADNLRNRGIRSAPFDWLPEPSRDQNAFQDAFKFKLVRIAHGEKRFVLRDTATELRRLRHGDHHRRFSFGEKANST